MRERTFLAIVRPRPVASLFLRGAILVALGCSMGWCMPEPLSPATFAGGESRSYTPPRGLVVFKPHIQADEDASVIEYVSLRLIPIAIDIFRQGGVFASIPRHQLVHHVIYPEEATDICTPEEMAAVQVRLAHYRDLAHRFPKAETFLRPWIARFEHEVSMWEDGFCLTGGTWVARSSFLYEQEIARLRMEFERKRADILGISRSPDGVAPSKEEPPPMWAVDMEQQLRDEQAAAAEERRKRLEQAQLERSKRFLESVEKERPFRTGWRLRPPASR